ncbi:MAG TPA: DUF2796 domain-containing protein [Limnobacter sp.]|nr:DUF2796 domain-containing protein [Limnobacter sp.]
MKQTSRAALFAIAAFGASGTALAGPHHHEHGVVRLDVAVDGQQLSVLLQSPLDSFVGFERAPRNDAEKKRAEDALRLLREGTPVLTPNAEAQCTLQQATVNAPVLEGKSKPKDGHADLEAEYQFTCASPEQLKQLKTGFYANFKHTKKVEVQLAGPKGQRKVSLSKAQATVQF